MTLLTGLYFGKRGKVSELPQQYQNYVPKHWAKPKGWDPSKKKQEPVTPKTEVKEDAKPFKTTTIKDSKDLLADDWDLVDGTPEVDDD